LTLLSMLPSLGASWVALQLLARHQVTAAQLVGSGVLVGAGIGAMHYSGMAAMQQAPPPRYDPWWFALPFGGAVGLAVPAPWGRFGLRGRGLGIWAVVLGGGVMGLAISGMHYTGMAAARFVGVAEDSPGNEQSLFLALAVALITVSLAIFVAAANGLLRYRQLVGQLRGNEMRLRATLNTAVDGIITIDERGLIRDINPSVEQLFGWRADELIGRNINMLMPEPHHSAHDGYLEHYRRTGEARII